MSNSENVSTEDFHRVAGALRDSSLQMWGEANELAARRPHPDAHLYDIEEGLRRASENVEEILDEVYYR
jgi:hypothetical protein